MIVKAPWTDEQVAALNRWQNYGFVHEFTCPNRDRNDGAHVLTATNTGWVCSDCDFAQDWANANMFDVQIDPRITLTAAPDDPGIISGWTVTDHPTDYPDYFVARRWIANRDGTVTQTTDILISSNLDDLRKKLARNPNLYRMDRQPEDEPQIVEVWI